MTDNAAIREGMSMPAWKSFEVFRDFLPVRDPTQQ